MRREWCGYMIYRGNRSKNFRNRFCPPGSLVKLFPVCSSLGGLRAVAFLAYRSVGITQCLTFDTRPEILFNSGHQDCSKCLYRYYSLISLQPSSQVLTNVICCMIKYNNKPISDSQKLHLHIWIWI